VHRNNILHRDIKGANIFLTDTGIVKLGDFGLSKQYDDVSECHRTEPLGTPLNFAPELYTPMPFCSVKTDIWATGVLLYEMLTLRHPFGEKYRNKPLTNAALETLRKDIFRAQFQPLPDSCCEGLKDLITSMLQFDPESRPDTEQLLKMHYVRKLLAKLKEHISHPDLHTKISEIERARILSDIDRAAPPAILCTQMMN
jgi:serine/threonine protein kinase